MTKLSPAMTAALRTAASAPDGSVVADRRTVDALARRGLVDVRRGRATGYHYQGPFHRSRPYTIYDAIVGVAINAAGREAVAAQANLADAAPSGGSPRFHGTKEMS